MLGKALLHCAEFYHSATHAAPLGMHIAEPTFDYAKIAARKDKVVSRLVGGIGYLMQANGVDVVNGRGVLTSAGTIAVGEETFTAENIILATGSVPAAIPIPGIDLPNVMNSDAVLSLTTCPESIVIIGGGVIGIEFASLFGMLGKKVTVIEMLPNIMGPAMDPDISAAMMKELKKRSVDVKCNARVLSIEEGMTVHYALGEETKQATGDIVIVAVGRKPNTGGIGLREAGVETDARGYVVVDDNMRTNIKNIYAIGDITGKIQLAHVASAQGNAAAQNICGGNRTVDYAAVPSCVYTDPEVATIGMTEGQAEKAGYAVKTGMFPMAGNGRSLVLDRTGGFVKLVTDATSGKVLGAQLMCANATEMIAGVSLAVSAGLSAEDVSSAIFPHPTVSEAIGEAAHDIFGLSNNKA